MHRAFSLSFTGIAALGALLAAGCQPQEQIERYSVIKPELVQTVSSESTPAQPQQTLVAMTAVDDSGWFFKLTGEPQRVAAQEEKFRAFLASVKFTGTDKSPQWQVPEGWTTGSAGGIRFATLLADTQSPPLEVAVTRLPKNASDDQYLLSNMNRWRTQLQLPEYPDVAAVREATQTLDVAGQTFTIANFTGKGSASGGMGAAPFAGLPPDHPPLAQASKSDPSTSDAPAQTTNLKFTLPEGWKQVAAAPPFSLAKFTVERDGKKLDISVSTAGGSVAANVNRWRDQIGLPAMGEQEVTGALKPIEVGSAKGQLVEIVNPAAEGKGILGVIVDHQGKTWFIKLMGDGKLAQQEKARFEKFVNSLQLP